MFNMVNGGTFGGVQMAFQEFLVIPVGANRYSEALRMGVEIYNVLGDVIRRRYGKDRMHVGSSAGYGAPACEPAEILETLLEATKAAGYDGQCRVGLDCAASHFYDSREGCYHFRGRAVGREELMAYLDDLTRSYDLFMLEDPLEENDFDGFATITRRVPTMIVGDDLFVTNLERVKRGVALRAANAMVLKPNMVGTISEALDAARFAQAQGYRIVGSGRAGGSIDDPIPDIAMAVGAPLVKFGAPRTGERLGKQNCLLRIEEELGDSARFAGSDVLKTG
jgi:enolase 1/2/3